MLALNIIAIIITSGIMIKFAYEIIKTVKNNNGFVKFVNYNVKRLLIWLFMGLLVLYFYAYFYGISAGLLLSSKPTPAEIVRGLATCLRNVIVTFLGVFEVATIEKVYLSNNIFAICLFIVSVLCVINAYIALLSKIVLFVYNRIKVRYALKSDCIILVGDENKAVKFFNSEKSHTEAANKNRLKDEKKYRTQKIIYYCTENFSKLTDIQEARLPYYMPFKISEALTEKALLKLVKRYHLKSVAPVYRFVFLESEKENRNYVDLFNNFKGLFYKIEGENLVINPEWNKKYSVQIFLEAQKANKEFINSEIFDIAFNELQLFTKSLNSKIKECEKLPLTTEIKSKIENYKKQKTDIDSIKKSFMMIAFNIYDRMAREFFRSETLLERLLEHDKLNPQNAFIDKEDLTLKDGKNVNAVFLGYGKVNSSMLRTMLLSNQFIGKSNNESFYFKAKPINCYIFDSYLTEKILRGDKMLSLLACDNEEVFIKDYTTEEVFGSEDSPSMKIEPVCNLKTFDYSFYGTQIESEIKKIVGLTKEASSVKDNFTVFYVNVGSDLDNLNYCLHRLYKITRGANCKIYVNLDSMDYIDGNTLVGGKNISVYGLKNNAYTSMHIFEDEIFTMYNDYCAKTIKFAPSEAHEKPFYTMKYIEKLSNVYSYITFNYKLALLGLEKVAKDSACGNEIKEQKEFLNTICNYDKYFSYSVKDECHKLNIYRAENITDESGKQCEKYYIGDEAVNLREAILQIGKNQPHRDFVKAVALMYYEKLRWNTLYYLFGYTSTNELQENNGNYGRIKNYTDKIHGCVRGFYGLYQFTTFRANKNLKGEKDAPQWKKDIVWNHNEDYTYDLNETANIFTKVQRAGYKIIRD